MTVPHGTPEAPEAPETPLAHDAAAVAPPAPAAAPPRAAAPRPRIDLEQANARLDGAEPADVVRWAYDAFGPGLILTSSFGAQAAVMLHLVATALPQARVPVVFIDTGYLFPETYQFADALTRRLNLNLKVYGPAITPARMEALFGRLWEDETGDGYHRYSQITKVEPMQRALAELGATAWLAGLRANQTDHRKSLRAVELQDGTYKVHPILRWSGKQVHEYLKTHDLPYHPLVEKGYLSIGDTHSTLPVGAEGSERAGRFRGLRQECGLHLPTTPEETASRDASGL